MSSSDLFFSRSGMDRGRVEALVNDSLKGADDGELYLEYRQSESFSFDDGRLKAASFDTTQGFGLRSVAGEATGYAHASEISEDAIKRAGETVRAVTHGYSGAVALSPARTNTQLYSDIDPLKSAEFAVKVKLLEDINAYARGKDPRVKQVSASLAGEWQTVEIIRPGGEIYRDIRPLVRIGVSVVVEHDGKQESGYQGGGGRSGYDTYLDPKYWHAAVDEALRQALVNLDSIPAPAGEMNVVLGPGWPGILLHEAIVVTWTGRRFQSQEDKRVLGTFLGERVASPGVTVVDDGTIAGRRGSLSVDDEGTPTSRTVLIEDGILKGYMQDRQNARLMGVKATGNGRRQSYANSILPRMTNTYMLGGNTPPEEIIKSVDKGIYATNFGGGQVDITNGKFVFSCTEAYLIENGKIGAPIKGATLIGSGPEALTRIKMIGNDMKLDDGIGTCGKNGQSVPVGVGQTKPSRLEGLTVGGTAA